MYRRIHTKIWRDPKLREVYSPIIKGLFVYLLTNDHSHFSGIYYLSPYDIEKEYGLEKTEAQDALKRLQEVGLIEYDFQQEIVWVKNMLKYQGSGAKIIKGVVNHLETFHETSLKNKYLQRYPKVKAGYPIDRVSDKEQEQEQDKDQEKTSKTLAKKAETATEENQDMASFERMEALPDLWKVHLREIEHAFQGTLSESDIQYFEKQIGRQIDSSWIAFGVNELRFRVRAGKLIKKPVGYVFGVIDRKKKDGFDIRKPVENENE